MLKQMKKPIDVTTPGETDVVVTRRLAAPPAFVFQAFTEPALVKRWLLGPPGWTMPVCDIDLRVGGAYRYRWRSDENGQEFGFTGSFTEIHAPSKIAHSEKPEDTEMGHSMVYTSFEPEGSGTLVRMVIRYASAEIRQQAVDTGMTDGMGMSYDLLDNLIAEVQPA